MKLLGNFLIYFILMSIGVMLVSRFLYGDFHHGFIPVRIVFAAYWAYTKPILKDKKDDN